MKKSILVATVITTISLSSAVMASDDYSGFRIGAGMSNSDNKNDASESYDSQMGKIEAGYDFNRIFSINGSFEYGEDSSDSWNSDTSRVGIEAEVGYAFELGNWYVKPYGAVGAATQWANLQAPGMTETENADDYGYTGAIGVRVNSPIGIYVDARVQEAKIYKDWNETQAGFTVGYKF